MKGFQGYRLEHGKGVKGREIHDGEREDSGRYGWASHHVTALPLLQADKDSSALWETGRLLESL